MKKFNQHQQAICTLNILDCDEFKLLLPDCYKDDYKCNNSISLRLQHVANNHISTIETFARTDGIIDLPPFYENFLLLKPWRNCILFIGSFIPTTLLLNILLLFVSSDELKLLEISLVPLCLELIVDHHWS